MSLIYCDVRTCVVHLLHVYSVHVPVQHVHNVHNVHACIYMYIMLTDMSLQNANKKQATDQDQLSLFNIGSIVILVFMMFLVLFAVHCTWVTSSAYSSPSVVLASQNPDG